MKGSPGPGQCSWQSCGGFGTFRVLRAQGFGELSAGMV